MKNHNEILKEAKDLLELLEHGKSYPAEYVVKRFQKAASDHSADQLIGNMADVLVKIASKREYIHQNEIGKLYDHMYGLSGGHTAFRDSLGDLLPENRQFAKVAYQGSNTRKMEEKNVEPIYKDSELSNAFSVLFSMGGDSAFGTYKPGQDKSVEKAVIAKLSSLGSAPLGVDILQTNEHFTLCAANFQSAGLNKISILLPVQTTDGVTREPQHLILGEKVVDLDGRNLFACIKEQERNAKQNGGKKFASERGTGAPALEMNKAVVPNSLKVFTELENDLIAAASKFSVHQINTAIEVLHGEFASFGVNNTTIKIASSDKNTIMFDVYIPTKLGKSVVHVPVEISGSGTLLPTRFAADRNSSQAIYDFSKEGFEKFVTNLNNKSASLGIARENGELSTMSYHQLMDQMIDGVSKQDYKLAEDVLQTIEKRFGSAVFMTAFDQFQQMLKHSSDDSSSRQAFIKAAYERGDLIKVPTSVDLYCPKLGLPVSKVEFDEKGRVIPKGRRNKFDQVQDSMISTNRILFT